MLAIAANRRVRCKGPIAAGMGSPHEAAQNNARLPLLTVSTVMPWAFRSKLSVLLSAGLLWLASTAAAQAPGGGANGLPLRARGTLGVGMMVSVDQVGYLGYDSIGLVSDLQLGYILTPWLDLQLAMAGGGFSAPDHTGGLLAPLGGATVRMPWGMVEPYALVQLGAGFTGTFTRPYFRAGVGVDFSIAHAFAVGPVLGYGHLFQTDEPGDSTDARFLSLGISLAFRADRGVDPKTREVVRIQRVTERSWLPAPPREPAPERPLPEPSPELLAMIEQTLPTEIKQNELLAPVLFQFDSAELEPIGVAMLHEVARELVAHPEIEVVEVQGYADMRGTPEYNDALSKRRADTVIAWLSAHGVAPERLRAAARGASAPVEPGDDEASYQQNRRVVFRVVQMRPEP
jgi:outer membrane protein OmpA-like peptidoglycan-associated protein